MSGWRPHNPWIDTAVILGVIGGSFVALPMVWKLASFAARYPQFWVSFAMAVALWVAIRWLDRGIPK